MLTAQLIALAVLFVIWDLAGRMIHVLIRTSEYQAVEAAGVTINLAQ